MEESFEREKKNLGQKFLEFQKKGLESYGKYLQEQLEFASKSDSRKAYLAYIEDQIRQNNERIARIDEKL